MAELIELENNFFKYIDPEFDLTPIKEYICNRFGDYYEEFNYEIIVCKKNNRYMSHYINIENTTNPLYIAEYIVIDTPINITVHDPELKLPLETYIRKRKIQNLLVDLKRKIKDFVRYNL